jgi:5-formyltetrahydrofolate cyclo-ligase
MSEWSGRHAGKEALRQRVWSLLSERGVMIGHGHGHIPDFVGAAKAAERLARLPFWQNTRVVKSNPDAPQMPVRLRALQEGKTLYMAVPRLRDVKCFVELTCDALIAKGVSLEEAAGVKGALAHGRPVAFEEMQPIDVVLVGCVAVSRNGGRTGKGAGFADLELGILRQFGLVNAHTPIATTVNSLQIVEDDALPMTQTDSALNWIATPDETIETRTPYAQPTGIVWENIQADQWASIPILNQLRGRR